MKAHFVVGVIGAALLLVAPVAFADYQVSNTFFAQGPTGYWGGSGGEFIATPSGTDLSNAAYSNLTRGLGGNSLSFQTFCVEVGEQAVPRWLKTIVSTTFIDEATGDVTGPGSHAILGNKDWGDNLDPRTAYLYTKFATGTLAGYDYDPAGGRATSAADLQAAIWYIEEEPWGGVNNGFVTLANDAVASGGEWYGRGIGAVRVLNVWDDRDLDGNQLPPGQFEARQDMLYLMVPAPAAALLGVLGLGLIGWAKRRLN